MDQLGAVAGKQYHGDGLSVTATPDGPRLRCAFQRLEGEVTRDGLWLRSTAGDAQAERFRVIAVAVERTEDYGVRRQSTAPTPLFLGEWMQVAAPDSESGVALCFPPQSKTLPVGGVVSVNSQTVRFSRPGLTEEYSVSVDGVRQDFIVEQRPAGDGELHVELEVRGAKAESLVNGARPVRYPARGTATEQREMLSHGARLVLDGSGRKLAYNRLRVTDARGQELTARLEVTGDTRLAVVVDDVTAVYPLRIDPTFSDADWISMGGVPGANGPVYAVVADGSGNLYIGGNFTAVDGVPVKWVAKWDGVAWSALAAGVNNTINALAVSGSDLYVGGIFTTAGGTNASRVAKWNGSMWSALGAGVNNTVNALVLSGSNLYVGGQYTIASGSGANNIAKWNGSAWSALGAGTGGSVRALAVSGSDLYVGGQFTTTGGPAASGNENNLAKWNGSA